MINKLFIGAAAALALSAVAFAQTTTAGTTTGAACTGTTSTGTATGAATSIGTPTFGTASSAGATAATACMGTGTSPGPTLTGVMGITQPGVAGGVTPYRPAGAPPVVTGLEEGLTAPPPPSFVSLPGPSSGPGLAGAINSTLQAGQDGQVGSP